MSVPCEVWADMDRRQAEIDRACIIAIIFQFMGFEIE